jgi:N-acetyl-gamma-glutamyl-phosphate reductase
MIEKNICIAGINGYTGKLLKKYIENHPKLSLIGSLKLSKTDVIEKGDYCLETLVTTNFDVDVLFLATPAKISIQIVKELYNKNIHTQVIDLSGAFRLPEDILSNWYGLKHDIKELQSSAKYGLSPFAKFTSQDKIIANPGCYSTCALLSLIPLLKHNIIKPTNIIIDAKSGVSGAGKIPREDLMFSEMMNNFFPYKINKHQHIPEILQGLQDYGVSKDDLFFTTSMLPIYSGIAMTIYADLELSDLSTEETSKLIENAYTKEYSDYPLFKFMNIDETSDDEVTTFLAVKSVVNTANIHVGFCIKGSKVMLFSSIDNLLKGAVTQAIENLNNYYDYPVTMGLGG